MYISNKDIILNIYTVISQKKNFKILKKKSFSKKGKKYLLRMIDKCNSWLSRPLNDNETNYQLKTSLKEKTVTIYFYFSGLNLNVFLMCHSLHRG